MLNFLKCNKSSIRAMLQNAPNKIGCKNFSSSRRRTMAAVLYAPRQLNFEERIVAELNDDEVLAQVEVCGICGSDMHLYTEGKLASFVLKEPLILGHEASGKIVECGKGVKEFKSGDKIAIEPQHGCRRCGFCRVGQYNICPNQWRAGIPSDNGALTRYFIVPYDVCYKLPENMDFEDGALIQPLTVVVQACRKADVRGGDVVFIAGAGTMGLMTVLTAKYFGASKIMITDLDEFKLCKAKHLGATVAVNVKSLDKNNIAKQVEELLGTLPNKSFDCVGKNATFNSCVMATKPGGRICLVGLSQSRVSLPSCIIPKELEIFGSFKIINTYPLAIDMVASGRVNLKPLISHHFKFTQLREALELIAHQTERVHKVLIHLNPMWMPGCPQT